jgi:hypothetical protein
MGWHQFVFEVLSTLLVTSSKTASEDNREKPPVKIHFYTVGARQHCSHWDDLLVQLGLKSDSKVPMCSCMTDLWAEACSATSGISKAMEVVHKLYTRWCYTAEVEAVKYATEVVQSVRSFVVLLRHLFTNVRVAMHSIVLFAQQKHYTRCISRTLNHHYT